MIITKHPNPDISKWLTKKYLTTFKGIHHIQFGSWNKVAFLAVSAKSAAFLVFQIYTNLY